MANTRSRWFWLLIVLGSLLAICSMSPIIIYEPSPLVNAAALKTDAYEAASGVVGVLQSRLGRAPIDRVEADARGTVKINLSFRKEDYVRNLSDALYVDDGDGKKLAADIAINVFGRVLETERLWVLDVDGRPLGKFTREDYETAKENVLSTRVHGLPSRPKVVTAWLSLRNSWQTSGTKTKTAP